MKHNILIALGSNENGRMNIGKMISIMKTFWPDVKQTDMIVSPAIDDASAPLYTNALVKVGTCMDEAEARTLCKLTEKLCGDCRELRKRGIVAADADILSFDGEKRHVKDWDRSYIQALLKRPFMTVVLLFCLTFCNMAMASQQKDNDKELFGKAIEYFAGQKYHEALLCFLQLEKTHKLNTRMLAYKGICLFKEKQYDEAAEAFEASVPELVQYSPHEQAVYYYAWAESYFQTQYYTAAVRCLEKALKVCEPEDKAEILYRLGVSETMLGNKEDAIEWFQQAIEAYPTAIFDESVLAHREQAKRMLRALLVTHGTSRVDAGSEETRQNEH